MQIISFRKTDDIDVQFLDGNGFIKEHTTYSNFKRGQVKNPYDITVCGVGYIGSGKFRTKQENQYTPTDEYNCWKNIIDRCYYQKEKHLHNSYYNEIEVCSEWHNYQAFGQWYSDNYYDIGEGRMHIDKDILYPGNKVYSPYTCIFVPQRINMLFVSKPNDRGLPTGITYDGKYYYAQYNKTGRKQFINLLDAYSYYSKSKEDFIKQTAEEYKDRIPQKLYEALIKYKVHIENDKNYVH